MLPIQGKHVSFVPDSAQTRKGLSKYWGKQKIDGGQKTIGL